MLHTYSSNGNDGPVIADVESGSPGWLTNAAVVLAVVVCAAAVGLF